LPTSVSATGYEVVLTGAAQDDFEKLDRSIQKTAVLQLEKLKVSPLYGKLCGNKHGMDLSACRSLHFQRNCYRIVYSADEAKKKITVLVIGRREGSAVYRAAATRLSDIDVQLGTVGVRVSGKARFPAKPRPPSGD
jgi:mRNA-degrading endonuclease RelE of RelBE toxin-antitoxin system